MASKARSLIPLLDRVLVQRFKPSEKTIGGVFVPETAQTRLNEGTVVAVGEGYVTKDGNKVAPSVRIGDSVLLPEYGGSTVKLNGEEFVLYRNDDILGVLKD